MPYLRGTKSTVGSYSKPSFQNQLNLLKRKVNQNTPSKSNHQRQYILTAVAAGITGATINVTEDFVGAVEYRDLINGDSFTNHTLRLSIKVRPEVTAFRVVVYTPKVTSSTYAVPTTDNEFTRFLDPAAFTIYHDSWVNRQADLDESIFFRNINLRRMRTIDNGSSGVLEKGNLRVCLMWNKGGGTTVPAHVSTMLVVSDK